MEMVLEGISLSSGPDHLCWWWYRNLSSWLCSRIERCSMECEDGVEITAPKIVPHPGSFTRVYGRPLILLPFFSLFLGFLFLMALFGGVRRYSHYKMWKSAGMPGSENMQSHWHKHHKGPFCGPPGYGWNKPEKTEDPGDEPAQAEPPEDA